MSDLHKNQENSQSRRDFIKVGAAAGLGTVLGGALMSGCTEKNQGLTSAIQTFTVPPLDKVRVAFVGVGAQGSGHVRNFLKIDGIEVKAFCDLFEDRAKQNQQRAVEAGQAKPEIYTRGETDFKRLCERDDIDLVYIATSWEWHIPIALEAMNTGKHAAIEVPAAIYLDECWDIVETSERTKRHCAIMENCCYDRFELMTLNMVRQGLLGELLHGENGYMHDLRSVKFTGLEYEGWWRRPHSIKRNGNLYPTHGLGPAAQCFNINRGDQFDYLVSMSSPSRGLQEYAKEHLDPADPRRKETYKLGDVNTSIIKTKLGKTIVTIHDCNLPRPYDRVARVQGTKGLVQKYPREVIYVEGMAERSHRWDDAAAWYEKYEHPLRTTLEEKMQGAGHGGMDFIEDYRLVQCLREGKPLDMDVYDAAAWSAVTELSEISVANRGKSVDFPDFTRGAWKTRKPLGIVTV